MTLPALPGHSLISALDFKNYDTMSSTNPDRQQTSDALRLQQIMQHQIPQDITTTQLPALQEQNRTVTNNMPILAEVHREKLSQKQVEIEFPTSTASATIFSSSDLAMECMMPSIYLSKNFLAWNEENLRSHGFTHIIIIDKHIQELYYPSPLFKISTVNTTVEAFDTFEYFSNSSSSSLKFGKEFEAIDLNFGEKSYLTTVLPNCYRAVKFINKALQACGTILVIDCNGSDQKCLTIIVAFLMYKHNISFSKAFARLKEYYKKADLDRFYMTQLYEYEPILQVQRAQSRGQSCSREMYSAILKRKKVVEEDEDASVIDLTDNYLKTNSTEKNRSEFFNAFNPLTNFNTSTTTTNVEIDTNVANTSILNTRNTANQHNQFFTSHTLKESNNYDLHKQQATLEVCKNDYCNAFDDYAME
ncbi:uncharacterized protein LOC101458659 [Ceratitis capitata]|uniref:uncharacterized protein LOC101458659 n=1 Tax=Ceratitis capitata TaxID=7213 RepID=UPI000329E389|nr:uncharacterized protein LOC101458659 [Ceratitis capitata]